MSFNQVAVVILNYNGKELLSRFLPSVIEHSGEADIYIADNASTDDSLPFLQQYYPQVKIIHLAQNYGFAKGYNKALKQVQAKYYVLLNSDVEVTKDWFTPVIQLMDREENIAACQPKIRAYHAKDEFEYAGACGGFIDKYGYPFCRGRIFTELEKDYGQYDTPAEIFWASGACMFVKADIYNYLHGFDESYFAHMEEIDLCWRMKNAGYKIMAVPQSVVYHMGGATLDKASPRKTYLNFRNNLATLTKNDTSPFLIFKIIFRLVLDGVAGIKFLLEGNSGHTLAVIKAHNAYFMGLGKILNKRKEVQGIRAGVFSKKGIYKRNIVADFYIKGKKRFSELNPNDFSV